MPGDDATVKFFLVLVHNKMDLEEPRQLVKKSQGEQKAKDLKIAFHCTSVMRDQDEFHFRWFKISIIEIEKAA